MSVFLEAVPNISEGRDEGKVGAVVKAFDVDGIELWDVHTDADHNRSVITIAGGAERLNGALLAGAAKAAELIAMTVHSGVHPCVGALDVAPVVYLRPEDRDLAHEVARGVAAEIGETLGVPVFLYGELAAGPERSERAFFRRGGVKELGRRLAARELAPDYGPPGLHPSAGATLVAARPPLVAFNIELDSQDVDLARRVAAEIRENGGGLPGLRAIGLYAGTRARAQISTNVERPFDLPLAEVVAAVERQVSPQGVAIAAAEIVGLALEASVAGFPDDIELIDFDRTRQILEQRIAEAAVDG